MKEQGEGGEVLLPASLRDGLAGAISEAVAKALLAGTLGELVDVAPICLAVSDA
jgi:hypothetical protein